MLVSNRTPQFPMTLTQRLDLCPPFLVFAVASRRTGISVATVANRSGLPRKSVARLAAASTWGNATVDELGRFCAACGVEPLRLKRVREYLRRTLATKSPLPRLTPRQRAVVGSLLN